MDTPKTPRPVDQRGVCHVDSVRRCGNFCCDVDLGKESRSMNIFRIKTVAALAIAVTGVLGSSIAQARPDVRWSVTIGGPAQFYGQPVYSQPEPVYYAPAPVYLQPRRVYVQPQPYYDGRHVEYRYPTRWDRDADGIPDRYERQHERQYERQHGRYRDHGWDRDRDGVPDQYDRRPRDPWRR